MNTEVRKSVDNLALQKSHPKALRVIGEQSRSQIRALARAEERRKIIAALAVSTLAAICIGIAIYRIMRVVWS